jgi:hypothetical protein
MKRQYSKSNAAGVGRWEMIPRLLWAAILLLAIPSVSLGQETVGFVLDMQGKWFLDGNPPRKIHKGSALPAGGSIYILSPVPPSAQVAISDRTGAIIVKKQCNLAGECDEKIRLPGPSQGTSSSGKKVSAVLDVFWKEEPAKYESYISIKSELPEGDLTADDVREAVVATQGGTLDLGPVFARVRKGRFYLRLNAITGERRFDHPPVGAPIVCDWDPAAPSPVKAPGVHPGLYEIERLEKNERGFSPVGVVAWVLVPKPDEYEKVSSCFGKAVQVVIRWGRDIKPDAARSYFRANLEYLFTEGARCAE